MPFINPLLGFFANSCVNTLTITSAPFSVTFLRIVGSLPDARQNPNANHYDT